MLYIDNKYFKLNIIWFLYFFLILFFFVDLVKPFKEILVILLYSNVNIVEVAFSRNPLHLSYLYIQNIVLIKLIILINLILIGSIISKVTISNNLIYQNKSICNFVKR